MSFSSVRLPKGLAQRRKKRIMETHGPLGRSVSVSANACEVMTVDGVRIAYDHYRGQRQDALLVVCPGFFQSKETQTFQRLSTQLAALCDVVCMDFRGHGCSGGLFTFSALEANDLRAVLSPLRERYPRIAALGFSLGAAVSINLAAETRCFNSIVGVSTPMSFEEIEDRFWTPEALKTGLRGCESGAGFRPGNPLLPKTPPISTIGKLSPIPVLLIHGTRDPITFFRHSERLFDKAREPKQLELIDGGGHAEDLYRQNPTRFLGLVNVWLTTTLLSAP